MLVIVVTICAAAAAGLLVLSSLTSATSGTNEVLTVYQQRLEQARHLAEQREAAEEA